MRIEDMLSKGTVLILLGKRAVQLIDEHAVVVVRKDGEYYGLVHTDSQIQEKYLAFTISPTIMDLWEIQGHDPLFDSEPGPRAHEAAAFFQWLLVERPKLGLKYETWIYKMIFKLFQQA
jgi:hypothetical protein